MKLFTVLLFVVARNRVFSSFEQKVVIDLDRNPVDNYGNGGTYGHGRFAPRGSQTRNSPYFHRPTARTHDLLPETTQELKDLIRQMDRAFSNRIESLSKRIDRLENNNNYGGNLRQAVQAEWTALNIDNSNKTIRVFHAAKNNWTEAVEICKENFGSLLHIESEEENQRISDMLRNTTDTDDDHKSPLYWIGEEAMATLILPPERYSNFDTTEDTPTEQHRGCAAVTAGNEGKWLSRDCAERHDFICQT